MISPKKKCKKDRDSSKYQGCGFRLYFCRAIEMGRGCNGWGTNKNCKHSLAYCKSPWWMKMWGYCKNSEKGDLCDCNHWRGILPFLIVKHRCQTKRGTSWF